MNKISYEIDPHNRLVLKSGKKSAVAKYRLSLDGSFRSGKANSLRYHVKAPYRKNTPRRINLKGRYSLTKDHNLLFTLRHSGKQYAKEALLLKGDIVLVKENMLGFAYATKENKGKTITRTLQLNGRWSMDKKSRIHFLAEKEKGEHDVLTLTGKWRITKGNEIEYTYKKRRLKRRTRIEKKIIFKGSWEIVNNHSIRYVLGTSGNSGFDIEASLVRTGLVKNKNALIYKAGARLKTRSRNITLFGKWRLTRNTGLLFEIRYPNGRRNYLAYGAEVKLGRQNSLVFMLRDKRGKSLGVELTLRHYFLGRSGEALFKLLASESERSITLSLGKLW